MTGPTTQHPEAHCQRCGERNPVWFTPLWNEVMRENGKDRWGIVCPRCFAELAEAKGIGTKGAWRWEPENYDASQAPAPRIDTCGHPWPCEDAHVITPSQPRQAGETTAMVRERLMATRIGEADPFFVMALVALVEEVDLWLQGDSSRDELEEAFIRLDVNASLSQAGRKGA